MYLAKKIVFLLILISTTFLVFEGSTDFFIITKITNHVYIEHPRLLKELKVPQQL
jgi:hypothetical protein